MLGIIREAKTENFKKLPGSFWVLSAFFNPTKVLSKRDNYRCFRENLARQGLKLLTVECALNDNDFELEPGDADKLIQVRSNSVLWHKERLLNIGLKNLPADCDKIAWLDADIIFLDDSWAQEVAELLEKYHFVKPFNQAIRLDKKETASVLLNNNLKELNLDNRPQYNNSQYSVDQKNLIIYMSVFGLCARLDIMQKIGFYDCLIIGSGDMIISGAILGEKPYQNILPPALQKDIEKWTAKASNRVTDKGIAFISNSIVHLFHGRMINRNYSDRIKILKKRKFDPNQDLELNEDECLEWGSNKKRMHRQVFGYFKNRNEDDKLVKGIKIFVWEKSRMSLVYFGRFIERQIGCIGIKLKKDFPKLYYFLKKVISWQK
ncbi:hypothetical protein GW758_00380 [Candidatus Falkowbacteria bacterium]|nr:hypothetical protein [Candidatus Falkowbacteria bacterium]